MLSGVMSAAKKVLEEALALPADERRRIAKLLLESVPQASTETTEAVEDAWVAEAIRRADEVEYATLMAVIDEVPTVLALSCSSRHPSQWMDRCSDADDE